MISYPQETQTRSFKTPNPFPTHAAIHGYQLSKPISVNIPDVGFLATFRFVRKTNISRQIPFEGIETLQTIGYVFTRDTAPKGEEQVKYTMMNSENAAPC